MAKRSYTEQDRDRALSALVANNGNLLRTSRETGVPRKTLEFWLRALEVRSRSAGQGAENRLLDPDSATDDADGAASDELTADMTVLATLKRAAAARALEALPKASAAVAMRTYEIAQTAQRGEALNTGWRKQLPRIRHAGPDGRAISLPSDAKPLPPGAFVHPDALRELAAVVIDVPAVVTTRNVPATREN